MLVEKVPFHQRQPRIVDVTLSLPNATPSSPKRPPFVHISIPHHGDSQRHPSGGRAAMEQQGRLGSSRLGRASGEFSFFFLSLACISRADPLTCPDGRQYLGRRNVLHPTETV
jgi:hypothetical protein